MTTHLIVLPGGGYAMHAPHEAEPIVAWLTGLGLSASAFRYPLNVPHPAPLLALRSEIRRRREQGAERIGVVGFSAGGHLAGLAALAPGEDPRESVQFAVLGYAITSMETESYRPARLILLGDNASPDLRRATSLDALVSAGSPPFFLWHTAEDIYVPPEHTYRRATGRLPGTGGTRSREGHLPRGRHTAAQRGHRTAVPRRDRPDPGATLVIVGAAGAVGGFALETAKADGLTVLAYASDADHAAVRNLGADQVVLRHQDAATDIRHVLPDGAPALIDGAALNARALGAVADGGALVSLKGWTGPTECGITIHPISSFSAATDTALLDRLARQAEKGELTLRVGDLLPASHAAEAHQRLAAGGVRGRLVLDFANPQW